MLLRCGVAFVMKVPPKYKCTKNINKTKTETQNITQQKIQSGLAEFTDGWKFPN